MPPERTDKPNRRKPSIPISRTMHCWLKSRGLYDPSQHVIVNNQEVN